MSHAPGVRVRSLALAALLCVVLPQSSQSQQTGRIRGTVTEAGTRRPLASVQVMVKGTRLGRLTDDNGVFLLLNVPTGEATVRVESIGFRAIEQRVQVPVDGVATMELELVASAIGLDEIVVTGTAGGSQKRSLGNDVASIKAAAITEVAPITNVQQLITGRTAGITMTASSGVLGGSSRMRIRGASSLNAGNEPVVYVDGVRVNSGTTNTGNVYQGINLLDTFNPNDIESIEVIKGPAAATLYGAEAATGVIQIITKKGRPSEGLQWTANYEYGELDWAVDRITTYWLCTDARMAALNSNPGCSVFESTQPLAERLLVDQPLNADSRSLAVIEQYKEKAAAARAAGNEALAKEWETKAYPCQYPQQAPCQPEPLRTGVSRNVGMSVRGGGESYNFYISGENVDENGTFFNNFNRRKGGRANFGFVPSAEASFGVNVGYTMIETQTPLSDNSSNSVLRNAYRGQAGGPSSQYLPGFRNFMPEFANKDVRIYDQERLTLGVNASYNPFPWWQNRLTVGLDKSNRRIETSNQIDQTGLRPFGANAALGSISHAFTDVYLWTVDYSGNATRQLSASFGSTFSAGMQLVKRRTESHSISGTGLVANQLNLVSSAATRSAGQGFSEQTSLGFFLEEKVGYKDRLFATAAVRVDDNSAFGRDFSLVVYPKASVAWVISEESFFNLPHVDDLKLRVAWGQAGNAPAPFSADRTYNASRAIVADQTINTLSTSEYGNPDLKAETGSEIEAGFDASLLGGKLGATFTAYHKTTKDGLLSVSDPPSSGWTGSHFVNVGEFVNKGLELTLDASVLRNSWLQWDITAALATNSNELVSFGTDAQGNPVLIEDRFGDFLSVQRHREGYPMGGYWATDVKRDANGLPILNASGAASVVDCVWEPEDGDHSACQEEFCVWEPEYGDHSACQEEFVGSPFPTRSLGLTNTFRIKDNLQVHAFLDYQGGFYQWCAICSVRTRIDQNTAQINDPRLDATAADWETYGKYERARLLSLQTKEFIYPADFLKLRELGVTYTVPRRFTSRAGISRMAVTLSGRNLWITTKYKGNADPEVNFTSTANFSTSDYGSIPMQRKLVLSTSFGF